MLSDAFSLLTRSLTCAIDTVDRLFNGMGNAHGVILAVFVIYSSYRFFLRPIVGGAGSDRASKGRYGANNSKSRSTAGDATDWIGEI